MNICSRFWKLTLVLFLTGGLIWGGWAWWAVGRYSSAMAAVDPAMAAGRFGMAARDLNQLLAWKPDSDEAAYVLGICEQARGRNQAAEQAWARVAPGSAFSHRAILACLRLFHDTGRLAAAEKLVIDAAEDPRNDRTDLLVLLVPIYSQVGRSDEAERLIEARWEHLNETGEATPEQSIKLVRLHIELTWKAPSLDNLRIYLDQVGRLAADDDRVWLGRANLAIQTGAHDEAKRWLDACQRRRPDDVPVWRAWLNWGIATNRMDVVQQAVKHLPALEATPAQLHRLEAWLSSKRGDIESERRELERLIAEDPADLTALDRLAQFADSGRRARANAGPGPCS
jgi:enediyne biosynthesis protein E4